MMFTITITFETGETATITSEEYSWQVHAGDLFRRAHPSAYVFQANAVQDAQHIGHDEYLVTFAERQPDSAIKLFPAIKVTVKYA